jgi:hypothetical protein
MKDINRHPDFEVKDSSIIEDLIQAYGNALSEIKSLYEYVDTGRRNLERTILRTEHGIVFDLDSSASITDSTIRFTHIGFSQLQIAISIVEEQHRRFVDYHKAQTESIKHARAKGKIKEN